MQFKYINIVLWVSSKNASRQKLIKILLFLENGRLSYHSRHHYTQHHKFNSALWSIISQKCSEYTQEIYYLVQLLAFLSQNINLCSDSPAVCCTAEIPAWRDAWFILIVKFSAYLIFTCFLKLNSDSFSVTSLQNATFGVLIG